MGGGGWIERESGAGGRDFWFLRVCVLTRNDFVYVCFDEECIFCVLMFEKGRQVFGLRHLTAGEEVLR